MSPNAPWTCVKTVKALHVERRKSQSAVGLPISPSLFDAVNDGDVDNDGGEESDVKSRLSATKG